MPALTAATTMILTARAGAYSTATCRSARSAGAPVHVDQWSWSCGFYGLKPRTTPELIGGDHRRRAPRLRMHGVDCCRIFSKAPSTNTDMIAR